MSVGDSKDIKISEEYSKSTLTYVNEGQVVHFELVRSTYSEREVEDDWEWADTKIVSERDRNKERMNIF